MEAILEEINKDEKGLVLLYSAYRTVEGLEIFSRVLKANGYESFDMNKKLDKKNDHKPIIYFPPFDQDILFYSSYGESGNNGLDIYYKKRLPGGGWSESIILPESLNTEYDDDYPFLNSDATTFYFSSMGHNSMGGFDIFKSIR